MTLLEFGAKILKLWQVARRSFWRIITSVIKRIGAADGLFAPIFLPDRANPAAKRISATIPAARQYVVHLQIKMLHHSNALVRVFTNQANVKKCFVRTEPRMGE